MWMEKRGSPFLKNRAKIINSDWKDRKDDGEEELRVVFDTKILQKSALISDFYRANVVFIYDQIVSLRNIPYMWAS